MTTMLTVENLRVRYPTRTGVIEAVRGVSFTLGRERLGIVGESGSGKSQTGRAIMGLTPPHALVSADKLNFSGLELLSVSARERRSLRGKRIAMVLQDPKYSLDPVMPIGRQITETLRTHEKVGRGKREIAPWRCWKPCRSAIPGASTIFIRMKCRAAWASA